MISYNIRVPRTSRTGPDITHAINQSRRYHCRYPCKPLVGTDDIDTAGKLEHDIGRTHI